MQGLVSPRKDLRFCSEGSGIHRRLRQMGVGPDFGFDRLSLPAMWKSGLRDAVEIMHVTVLASVKYSLLILISSSTT